MEAVTAVVSGEEPVIKYESPYGVTSLKRRHSDMGDETLESDLKRQRVEEGPLHIDDYDLDSMVAQAAASAVQSFETLANCSQANRPEAASHDQIANCKDTGYNAVHSAEFSTRFSSDPHLYMRILSLPILESLAGLPSPSTQIIATLAQGPYPETLKIITQAESEVGQAYATLKSLFDQTKKIYSQQAPFLSADELNIREPEHRATIRTTNLATFVSSVFGGQDVGFYELNDHFIETFVPDGGELLKDHGMLYLNLKTQMYLSAISQEEQERSREEILDDLFPDNLAETLQARHPETPLSPNETDFVSEAKARREHLQGEPGDADSISALSDQFSWEEFLRNLSAHLKESYEPFLAPYMKRHSLTAPVATVLVNSNASASEQHNLLKEQDIDLGDLGDFVEQATQAAAQAALETVGYASYNRQPDSGQPQQGHPQEGNDGYSPQYPAGSVPYHTQTAPTQVLYEQARQAAVSKSSPHSRRPGLPSQRRPWSTEEENALMAGLDQVKGPHWSQILALYGAKGSVSEILKDRNQVQLKDKARNLKLFFLKSNIEVPYYLQSVTGELKTRAPSQAARKEAEERARLASDDEVARFNGVMALAGGIVPQSNHGLPSVSTETSREHSQESFPVPEDGMKYESPNQLPPSDNPSFEDTLGARLKESIEDRDVSPISKQSPVAS